MSEKFKKSIDYTTADGLKRIVVSLYDNYQFTAKDLGIDSRTISYWKEKELLTWLPSHKTGKFNFLQAAWMCVLRSLKKAGQEVEMMKRLTNYFIEQKIDLKRAIDIVEAELTSIKEIDEMDSPYAKNLKKCLENEKEMNEFRSEINYFTELVHWGLKTKKNCGIFIGGNDYFESYHEDATIYPTDHIMSHLFEFQIAIPLQPILSELIGIEIKEDNYETPVLTDDERLILKELKREDVDTIIVTKKDKEITVKVGNGKEMDFDTIMSELRKGNLDNWDNIHLSKRNKTSWYIKKEKRIKK